MSLKEYHRKRDFKKTAEPAGRAPNSSGNRFVIQKHAASRLHYDFRLEMDGVLKSWAVPKGMPYTKGEKHLAVEVEDHPVDYIDFEGTIPQGQYGGGTVMVWDRGTYETASDRPAHELADGKLHFTLHGKKLKGEWYLVRLKDEKQWLLIKAGKDHRPVSARQDDTSALSRKSMRQLSASKQVWNSNAHDPDSSPLRKRSATIKVGSAAKAAKRISSSRSKTGASRHSPRVSKALPVPSPHDEGVGRGAFIEPMKARLVSEPPDGNWIYEVKFDGYRALAFKQGTGVQIFSRNAKSFNDKFATIVDSVKDLAADEAILDGEIVALDAKGRSSFQLLQAFELHEERPPLFYYVFDLLRLEGVDLTSMPLAERKARLEKLIKGGVGSIRYSASLEGNVPALLKKAGQLGLEGLIGKQADSTYEAGRRTGAWIKLKLHHEQEMVIGGYTPPGGSRQHLGALLLGYYEHKKLKFAGKVGTGFNERMLDELHVRFKILATTTCPFVNLPEPKRPRFGQGITAAEMKRCHWLQPKLVCQVKFGEWTRDGKLRQPVFLGLREDKSPVDVIRERAVHL